MCLSQRRQLRGVQVFPVAIVVPHAVDRAARAALDVGADDNAFKRTRTAIEGLQDLTANPRRLPRRLAAHAGAKQLARSASHGTCSPLSVQISRSDVDEVRWGCPTALRADEIGRHVDRPIRSATRP